MSERKVGSVTYQEVGEEYFKQRGLRRHAGMWSLWALGVGAVISGEYYGWNFGLSTGGFGGLLVAGAIMAVMYYGLVYSIAEMSPALPHTGGAYSFARSAMGPWGGFLTGLAENMEYVITPAVVVGAMGLLMQTVVVGLFDVGGKFAADGTVTNIAPVGTLPSIGGGVAVKGQGYTRIRPAPSTPVSPITWGGTRTASGSESPSGSGSSSSGSSSSSGVSSQGYSGGGTSTGRTAQPR